MNSSPKRAGRQEWPRCGELRIQASSREGCGRRRAALCNVGVDHGSRDILVAKDFLDGTEVVAVLKQRVAEAVAKRVGVTGLAISPSDSLSHSPLDQGRRGDDGPRLSGRRGRDGRWGIPFQRHSAGARPYFVRRPGGRATRPAPLSRSTRWISRIASRWARRPAQVWGSMVRLSLRHFRPEGGPRTWSRSFTRSSDASIRRRPLPYGRRQSRDGMPSSRKRTAWVAPPPTWGDQTRQAPAACVASRSVENIEDWARAAARGPGPGRGAGSRGVVAAAFGAAGAIPAPGPLHATCHRPPAGRPRRGRSTGMRAHGRGRSSVRPCRRCRRRPGAGGVGAEPCVSAAGLVLLLVPREAGATEAGRSLELQVGDGQPIRRCCRRGRCLATSWPRRRGRYRAHPGGRP